MITAKHVRDETTILFDRIQVDYEGCTYAGPGLGRWVLDRGLLIDGIMKSIGGDRPSRIEFGVPQFTDNEHLRTIRLRTRAKEHGVIFLRGGLRDQLGLLDHGHLEIRSPGLIAWNQDAHPPRRPTGCLVFEGKPNVILPHSVKTEVKVSERTVLKRYERGLDYLHDGYNIVVRSEEKEKYTIWWGLPDADSVGGHVGAWPRALALAWRFANGESVWPVASEFQDTRRRIVVFARSEEAVSVGRFSLTDSSTPVTGDSLLALARLFVSGSDESHVAERLLSQCFGAARATTWHEKMLLLGTALEAVLRTLYRHPFEPRKKGNNSPRKTGNNFNRNACLDLLWNDYFDGSWETTKSDVKGAFERVRHRSAHPDWLRSYGGALSSAQEEETFDDLVFLSRFYGYLILAMAGVPKLEPQFPAPVSKWRPTMTFSRGGQKEAE